MLRTRSLSIKNARELDSALSLSPSYNYPSHHPAVMTATPAPQPPPQPQPPTTTTVDLSTLLTRSQIEQHLSLLTFQESTLDTTLSSLISSRTKLANQLKALESLRQVVGGIQGEAEHMAREVGNVAETAERVGGKVRVLDEEQVGLLQSCMKLVGRGTGANLACCFAALVPRQGFH